LPNARSTVCELNDGFRQESSGLERVREVETTAKYLTEHYQQTYQLTYALWQSRNKTFLILLGAIGVATFVMFPALNARSILFLYVRHTLQLSNGEFSNVQSGFPFGILQAIFLSVIFYLMVNLYHLSHGQSLSSLPLCSA
jgi:hypothetical protein